MPIFDYTGLSSNDSKTLFEDSLTIAMYAYHNLDNGFTEGYQKYGAVAGLPLTALTALFGSTTSQGVVPGLPWNPDSEKTALATLHQAGWAPISPQELKYAGPVDSRGTFFGEPGYASNQVEVLGKYTADGQLSKIGIAFRGTSGPREILIPDTLADVVTNLLLVIAPPSYTKELTYHAFNTLLESVKTYAQAKGLTADNIIVTGHSLGGAEANSMLDSSPEHWSGFYNNAHYVPFASPTIGKSEQVLNVGFENDPVFRVLPDPGNLTIPPLLAHDTPQPHGTNNIVVFNDVYASDLLNILPFSILNPISWFGHMPMGYNLLPRIINSEFYNLTDRDSTVIVADLSDPGRSQYWVQDLNRAALPHTGPTFIIGSQGDDFIRGSSGTNYLDGGAGNDTFSLREGSNNIVLGGAGNNTWQTGQSLNQESIASDGHGTLYAKDQNGGISILHDVQTITSVENAGSFSLFNLFSWSNHNVDVAHSVNGSTPAA